MRDPLRIRALGLAVLFVSFEARAADYYVNPSTGSATNDGSAAKPWKTLEEVIQAGLFGSKVKGGDTVHLADGYHGEMAVSGGNYAPPISVKSVSTPSASKARASMSCVLSLLMCVSSVFRKGPKATI